MTARQVVRYRIEVVAEDGDACSKLLRALCAMIDADKGGGAGYSVSKTYGSASCDVNALDNLSEMEGRYSTVRAQLNALIAATANTPVSGGTPSAQVVGSACCFCQSATGGVEIATTGTPMHRQCLRNAALGELEQSLLPTRGSACLGALLARDIFKVGDFPAPTKRIQFMAGTWPDHEKAQGGMCEKALAEFIAKRLDEYMPNAVPSGNGEREKRHD
jgi:hypothetical protein